MVRAFDVDGVDDASFRLFGEFPVFWIAKLEVHTRILARFHLEFNFARRGICIDLGIDSLLVFTIH